MKKLQQDSEAIAKAFALVAEHGQRSINRFEGLLLQRPSIAGEAAILGLG